ncbi:MAG: hypothetical protein JW726_17100, partial [Anaerolineales bacterium]|nr:hypothetical protein [Anaerolineales bacterium]
RFLVEGFRHYWGTTAVGADAGWWIPFLAGRENTMPPQYALLNEAPIDAEYSSRVVALVEMLETTGLDTEEGVQAICAWGITHAYIGQGQGLVGYTGPVLFSAEELSASPAFEQVYHQDRVYIFALRPEACR